MKFTKEHQLTLYYAIGEVARQIVTLWFACAMHGIACLSQYLVLSEVNSFFCHIKVPDSGFRSLKVLSTNVNAFDCHLKSVLIGSKIRPLFVDNFQSFIKNADVSVGLFRCGK